MADTKPADTADKSSAKSETVAVKMNPRVVGSSDAHQDGDFHITSRQTLQVTADEFERLKAHTTLIDGKRLQTIVQAPGSDT